MSSKHEELGVKHLTCPVAVYAMVLGAFAVGADEFIVAGVVIEISEALSVTIGEAGHLESVYAIGVAIGAPLFAFISLRLPRRLTLLSALVVFVVGNVMVVSEIWWKFSGDVLRAWGFAPDQAARSRLIGAMG